MDVGHNDVCGRGSEEVFDTPSLRRVRLEFQDVHRAAPPMAVGVASGAFTLTLPAVAISAWWCRREDRLLVEQHGQVWRDRVAATKHWVPGIW